jgi:hypothetical protein
MNRGKVLSPLVLSYRCSLEILAFSSHFASRLGTCIPAGIRLPFKGWRKEMPFGVF